MKIYSNVTQNNRETEALVLGALAILGFSLTLPATRVAVAELGAIFVGLGRAIIAAALAAVFLAVNRTPLPTRRQLPGLAIVGLGVIVGFPFFSALALRSVPASHAAVISGLGPAATAIFAVLRAGERPRPAFWLACAAGVVSVCVFALVASGGVIVLADVYLLVAVTLVGLGYAEGGRLARDMGGMAVIAWALVLATPFLLLPVTLVTIRHGLQASATAWLGFAYISTVSMFLAFIAWYRSLAIGGIARTAQLQLAQPVLTMGFSVLLIGETIDAAIASAGVVVLACTVLARLTRAPAIAVPQSSTDLSSVSATSSSSLATSRR